MPGPNILERIVDSHDRGVGGGSAAALAGSMAAGLVSLVARLSEGGTHGPSPGRYRALADEADALSRRLHEGAHADADAYRAVVDAYRLPRDDPEGVRARQAAVQQAVVGAATVPLDNARTARRVRDLCAELEGASNPNASSDLAVALLLAEAAIIGCICNVEINLPLIEDDGVACDLRLEADRLKDLPVPPAERAADPR